jgi:hypothetical protein
MWCFRLWAKGSPSRDALPRWRRDLTCTVGGPACGGADMPQSWLVAVPVTGCGASLAAGGQLVGPARVADLRSSGLRRELAACVGQTSRPGPGHPPDLRPCGEWGMGNGWSGQPGLVSLCGGAVWLGPLGMLSGGRKLRKEEGLQPFL